MTPDETLPEEAPPPEGDEAGADSEAEPLLEDAEEGAGVIAPDPEEEFTER